MLRETIGMEAAGRIDKDMYKKICFIAVPLILACLLLLYGWSNNTVIEIRKSNNQDEAEKSVQITDNKDIATNISPHRDDICAIIERNSNEIAMFFDKYPISSRWIEISGYDFTKDGNMEIILSYVYVETSTTISYNNVFDDCGNLLFRFVTSDIRDAEIFVDETVNKYYIQTRLHIAANHDVTLYQEISYNKNWNMEIMFTEWDCRPGQERIEDKKEGYSIYESFTQVEKEDILKTGYENMLNIFQMKEANGTVGQLEKYVQGYDKQAKEKVVLIGEIYPKTEDINWISE